MAYYQIAYTFDVERFHAELESKVVKDGVFDYSEMQRMAQAIMANPSEVVREIASAITYYDEEWLDDPDGDHSHDWYWYTILLWGVAKPTLSLSNNRLNGSHWIIEDMLPHAGWKKEDSLALVHGKQIDTLFAPEDTSVFATTWRSFGGVFGGCLSVQDAIGLLEILRETEPFFFSPDVALVNSIIKLSPRTDQSAVELLQLAYQDAIDMLETAVQRKEALYVLRMS